jgi:hypothetical protein
MDSEGESCWVSIDRGPDDESRLSGMMMIGVVELNVVCVGEEEDNN